jgi:hypothetical protein
MAYANLASATKLGRANQIITAIGSGGFLQLWTATAPASPDLAPNGVMLASLPLSTTPAVASYGLAAGAITAAGTGGSNGEYNLTITGGSGSGALGTFSVVGGILASIMIGNVGSGFITPPTLGGFTSAGLTGAAASAVMTATLVFNAISTATAVATGNAGWARVVTSGGVGIIDLDVGITNAFSVVMDNTFVSHGGSVACSAQVLIEA